MTARAANANWSNDSRSNDTHESTCAPESRLYRKSNTAPARGNAPQHYVFTLIAMSREPEALPPGLDKATVLDALNGGKALDAASLVWGFNH
jgi:phosphatidylethanolamine-binding protein (PEBP) family uncharacterized protein